MYYFVVVDVFFNMKMNPLIVSLLKNVSGTSSTTKLVMAAHNLEKKKSLKDCLEQHTFSGQTVRTAFEISKKYSFGQFDS